MCCWLANNAVCASGYGAINCTACPSGTYSQGPTAVSNAQQCQACPASTPFSFQGMGAADDDVTYDAPTVSQNGSTSAGDCVAQFGQLTGSSTIGPLTASVGMTAQPGVTTLNECVSACAAAEMCQFLVFDYLNATTPCQVRLSGSARAATNSK